MLKKSIYKARYLIHPSKFYETFRLSIHEAMNSGIPVMGFDIGTINDIIVNGYNGFVTSINKLRYTIIDSRNNNYGNVNISAVLNTPNIFKQRLFVLLPSPCK